MQQNVGKFFVGKVSDFEKRKGWFFGSFADNQLLKTDAVEIAWQDISGTKPSSEHEHYHANSVEINIVLSGVVQITINGERQTVRAGEFYVVWPKTVVKDIETEENTQLIVVRAPSLKDDKFLGSPTF